MRKENIQHVRVIPARIGCIQKRFAVALQNVIVAKAFNAAVLRANGNKPHAVGRLLNAVLNQMKGHARALRLLHNALRGIQRLLRIHVSINIQNGKPRKGGADARAHFLVGQAGQLGRHSARPQPFGREMIHMRVRHQQRADFGRPDSQIRRHRCKMRVHIDQEIVVHQRAAVAADISSAQKPCLCAIRAFAPYAGIAFSGARPNKYNLHLWQPPKICRFS